MNFIEKNKRIEYLLKMIEKEQFVSIKQMSSKFCCSESTIKRMLSTLRVEGHFIKYNRKIGKFFIDFSKVSKNDL